MRPHLLLTFLAAVTVLAGCETLHVRSDVNSGLIATVSCHTFSFAGKFRGSSPLRNSIANPVNEDRLREAITAHLQAAGAQPVESNAQCLVGYGIGSHRVVDGVYPVGWEWGWPGYGPWGWYGAWGGPIVYNEGYVTIDLYDAASRQAIWHASVDQSLFHATGQDAEKRIRAAVDALFAKFPAKTG
jgi:hypothetical protein